MQFNSTSISKLFFGHQKYYVVVCFHNVIASLLKWTFYFLLIEYWSWLIFLWKRNVPEMVGANLISVYPFIWTFSYRKTAPKLQEYIQKQSDFEEYYKVSNMNNTI